MNDRRRRATIALIVILGLAGASLLAAAAIDARAGTTACTIDGTAGADVLVGTRGPDVICAEGGNDWIHPGPGNDLVLAGPGNDFVHGSAGADVVRGGNGRDYLVGGKGPDRLAGQDGDDRCLHLRDGVAGNDRADGGAGLDTGTRDGGDTFAAVEIESQAPPFCPPAPPKPQV